MIKQKHFDVELFLIFVCNFHISKFSFSEDNRLYNSCLFILNDKNRIEFRVGKRTPAKDGHFVVFWKRDEQLESIPFDIDDEVDFFMVYVRDDSSSRHGYFLIPKSVLAEKEIISISKKGGKRGFRLYAPWVLVGNSQARCSQLWQINYFFELSYPVLNI
ncbi:hypothetical protein FJ366_01075 [Candidatus Dependentiae bacterium]|nr:hypothetical protein [Candidatus Dependentiae bacterium]